MISTTFKFSSKLDKITFKILKTLYWNSEALEDLFSFSVPLSIPVPTVQNCAPTTKLAADVREHNAESQRRHAAHAHMQERKINHKVTK